MALLARIIHEMPTRFDRKTPYLYEIVRLISWHCSLEYNYAISPDAQVKFFYFRNSGTSHQAKNIREFFSLKLGVVA
jgi:hypothetical protein